MDGYHLVNRRHALAQLEKTVYVPNNRLGVGEAEYLAALNIAIYYPQTPKAVYIPVPKTLEDMTADGAGLALKDEDFPSTGYIGAAIGGF